MENKDLKLSMWPTEPHHPFLLAADLDGTLLGDPEGETQLKAFVEEHGESLHIAYVTGRTLSSVESLVSEGRLPKPGYICSVVGTEILDMNDPDNRLGQKYASLIPSGWDPEIIYTLGEGEGARRQVFQEGQPRFQAGFDWDGRLKTLESLRSRLAGLSGIRILPSYGQYIDVLPDPLGKGGAVRFLRQELILDPDNIVIAGDSGNDREMFETGFKGIVPVNGLEELKIFACQPWHYHSSLPAALGVLDGLRYFGFIQ